MDGVRIMCVCVCLDSEANVIKDVRSECETVWSSGKKETNTQK